MNINNLELTMEEIYELVFRNHKDESRSYSLNHFGKTLKECVLEIKPSGRDFFGNYVWNCEDLISWDIASRDEIEMYVREKIKFINVAFDTKEHVWTHGYFSFDKEEDDGNKNRM